MTEPVRIAIVGLGKIALDQHVPAIAASPDFELAATASPGAALPGVAAYNDLGSMAAATPDLQAIVICTPPQSHAEIARAAIGRGLHVMIEKPPGVTVGEMEEVSALADARGVSLFAAWHSREAAALTPARALLAGRTVRSARIIWKEDVRYWHPGQLWLWEPGGFGVFDPGINALSLITALFDAPLQVREAELRIPANCATPIQVDATFDCGDVPIAAEFDFLQTGPQTWDIEIETDAAAVRIALGGAQLFVDGDEVSLPAEREYPRLYERFADLIVRGASDADLAPLRLVSDLYLLGRRVDAPPFHS